MSACSVLGLNVTEPSQASVSKVVPACVQRLADRLALVALITTAFAFSPSTADLLQCFYIR